MSPHTLIDLPLEIQVEIFKHLLVLEPGASFEDATVSKEPLQIDLIRRPKHPEAPISRIAIWASILRVHKALTPTAEYVLYSRNAYVFNSPATLSAFNKRSSPYGLTPRSVHLQDVYLGGHHVPKGTSAWIPYLKGGNLLRDMPKIKLLHLDLTMDWEQEWDEEEGAELQLQFFRPALAAAAASDLAEYIPYAHFPCCLLC